MDISTRHLLGIDQALAVGAVVPFNGREYTISPLTFCDYAKIVGYNKSQALAAYLLAPGSAARSRGQRIQDMNGIMCRPTLKADFASDNLDTLPFKFRLALQKTHPAITEKEVDDLLTNDEWREALADIMQIADCGPIEDASTEEAGVSPENPT